MCASSSTEKIRQPSGRGVTFALAVLACLLAVIAVGPSIVRHIRQLGNRFLSSGQVLIVHDLGPVLVETPTAADASRPPPRIAHRFTIENPSPHQSLRLALEKRSCGCLSVTEPEPIPPNGTGQVELAFVPAGQLELRSELASFTTNLQQPRSVTLLWKAHLLPRVELLGARRRYIPYGGPYRLQTAIRYHSPAYWHRPIRVGMGRQLATGVILYYLASHPLLHAQGEICEKFLPPS